MQGRRLNGALERTQVTAWPPRGPPPGLLIPLAWALPGQEGQLAGTTREPCTWASSSFRSVWGESGL